MECTVRSLRRELAARGIALLTPASISSLGVAHGEYVSLTDDGTEYVVARVHEESFAEDDGPVVGIDTTLCERLGVDPGDPVSVEPAAVVDAETVTIAVPQVFSFVGDEREFLGSVLTERALTAGTPVAIALPLDDETAVEQHLPIRPTAVDPPGPAVVTEETTIEVVHGGDVRSGGATRPTESVSYEDVGGLDTELEQVRELIELPLEHPGLFDRLGIDPPTGVLLHGPPGTGKTLIARAVADEVDAAFVHVDGPEIVDPGRGMAERTLRDTFETAREDAPAVLFLDELDAIAPDRSGARTAQTDTQLVAQLLTLLDGVDATEDVVVIAATNRPDAIDPALRRAGRFDREVEIGVPAESGRAEILGIHARDVPLADGVDLEEYAAHTHGYVGADLEALLVEAGLNALDRVYHEHVADDTAVVEAQLDDVEVTVADVDQALTDTEPSAMRALSVDVPAVSWDDVGGLDTAIERLRELVQWPLDAPRAYRQLGIEPASGVLLYGPPGTGKTLLAKAVASESDCNFLSINGPELLDRWVGSSEEGVRELFDAARSHSPAVICFDELDAIAPARDGGSAGSDVTDRVVSQLLTELDGIDPLETVFVIGTTNRPELIDDALRRPGRLDYQLEIPLPDAAGRRSILDIHLADKPVASSVDRDTLVAATEGFSGADIAAVCREAALVGLRAAAPDDPQQSLGEVAASIELDREQFHAALQAVETTVRTSTDH
jgi:transitional endoplasmic reticulum ATPase